MKSEVEAIITRLDRTLNGEPWYGKSILHILEEVDAEKANVHKGGSSHTMLDIIYHMNTWVEFTLKRIQQVKDFDMQEAEELDWRKIEPKKHSWKKAVTEFKALHKEIEAGLALKDDSFLVEIVEYRKYNFRFLINGLIDHNIYHAGQIAVLNKMPDV